MYNIKKKINYILETQNEDLLFTHVEIKNFDYGIYPAEFDVVLTYQFQKGEDIRKIPIEGKLLINKNCKPEFRFDIGEPANALCDRSGLSNRIFSLYAGNAVHLFYGVKKLSCWRRISGINVKWLREYYNLSCEEVADLLDTDIETLKKFENNEITLSEYRNNLKLDKICEKYNLTLIANPYWFIREIKFLPLLDREVR